MKKALFLVIIFVCLWVTFNAYLLDFFPKEYLPRVFAKITLPNNAATLGDSAAVLESLFSSIALALSLIAIFLQGKELKTAAEAQTDQAISLSKQLKQQENSNKIVAYSARLQYLLSESDRLDLKINELVSQIDRISDKQEKEEIWRLIKNLRNKEVNLRKEAGSIDELIRTQLIET